MIKRVSLLLLFVFSPLLAWASNCDGAGNCYVYAAATGSGNGSSWTNACTGFTGTCAPSSMTRGVTYWVAAGSYGAVTFNTPDSGTSVITIEAPTATNHGPASDWNSSFAGQAVFTGGSTATTWPGVTITTDYWTFNGQTRGSDWVSGYNLKFWNQDNGSGQAILIPQTTTNLTFEYVEIEGTGMTGGAFPNNATADKCNANDCGVWGDVGIFAYPEANNFYMGYSYLHHTGNEQISMNQGVSQTSLWEYNLFAYNHCGQNGLHDEALSILASNITFRYNMFQDICGSAEIATASASVSPMSDWAVYGNLFFWDPTYATLEGYDLAQVTNAILDFLGEKMSGYVYFCNNTIAGMNSPVLTSPGSGYSTMAISGNPGYSVCGTTCPTVYIYNNLWWNSAEVEGDFSSYCSVVTGATCTEDYETVYNGSVPSGYLYNAGATLPGAHSNTIMTTTANPFVSFPTSSGFIAAMQLTTPDPFASNAGITLASPYNFDGFNQVTRGANGTWDRGAEQLGSAAPPAPPTGLTATAH